MTDARRIKIVKLGPQFLAGFLSAGNHFFRVTENAMPEDATVVNAQMDIRNGEMLLQVHSMTFEPCPPGNLFEQITPALKNFDILEDILKGLFQ